EKVGEYIFDEECYLNLLDADVVEEFLSRDMASVIAFEEQRETLQQCLTTECISTTLSETFNGETSFESFDFDFENPTKKLKFFDRSDNITKNFSQQLSASPSTFQSSQIPSLPNLGNTHFSALQTSKESSKNQNVETKTSQSKRSSAHVKDHIMVERKRREKLGQAFIALATLIPDLKKKDKASVLADTIKHIKELKERLAILEEVGKNTKEDQSMMVCNKPDHCCETESVGDGTAIKVAAKVSGKKMLIRIHCQKHDGLLVKVITEIQSFQLLVVNNRILAFGDSFHDITVIAEIGEGYNLTIKELVRNLRMAALKFMSS
ncbi:basic helix loop helix (bHLH) DNA-binding family protein, partial [Medicago truncatula]